MGTRVLGVAGTQSVVNGTDSKSVIAANVRALMLEKGWSQRRLAKESGASYKAINKLVNGESAPTSDTVDKLAAAFDLAPWQLSLPIPPDELGTSGRFRVLLNYYLQSSPDSRDEIHRVAERESKYRK